MEKSLEVSKKLHMGVLDREFGQLPCGRPADYSTSDRICQ